MPFRPITIQCHGAPSLIDPRDLISNSRYEVILESFNPSKLEKRDLPNRRDEFYGLQKFLHAILERLGEFNTEHNASRLMFGEYQSYKGDGFDGLRVVRSLAENFCKQSVAHPALVYALSRGSYAWPILMGAGAKAIDQVIADSKTLGLAIDLTLELRPKRRARPSSHSGKTGPVGEGKRDSKPRDNQPPPDHFTGIPEKYRIEHRLDELRCIDEQNQISDFEVEWLLRSFFPARRHEITPFPSKSDFYALQKLLLAVLERLARHNRSTRAHLPIHRKLRFFRNDGYDGLRVTQSIAEAFCEISAANVRALSERTYAWPILYEAGANSSLRIKKQYHGLGVGLRAQLKLKQSRKGFKRGEVCVRSTWNDDEMMDSKLASKAACNAVLIHHYLEVTAYYEHDRAFECRFQRNEETRRFFHNESVRNEQGDSTFVHRPAELIPNRGVEIPDFRARWQTLLIEEDKKDKIKWRKASAETQFKVIWEKILGEYLDAPEKAPRNIIFKNQQDLRPIGKSKMIGIILGSKRFMDMKHSDAVRIIEREIDQDQHAGKSFQNCIENRLKKAFYKLRGVRRRKYPSPR